MYNRSNSAEEFRWQSTILRKLPPSVNGNSGMKFGIYMQNMDNTRERPTVPNSDDKKNMNKILKELEETGFFNKARLVHCF
jgi:hypothetical protein